MSMAAVSVVKKPSTLLKIKDAAQRLNMSPRTVLRLVNENSLSAIDVSGGRNRRRRLLRIAAEEVTRFLGVHTTYKPDNNATD